MRTKASAALAAKVTPEPPEMSQAELAVKLGVRKQAVHAWTRGLYEPSVSVMLRLEKLLGIPVVDWTKPERP